MHGPERLVPSNLDGRVFLRALAEARTPCDHVIMNLPATAIDFLGTTKKKETNHVLCVVVRLPFQSAHPALIGLVGPRVWGGA